MAGEKNGTDVLLFAKIGMPAAWVALACLKSNSWSGSTGSIETSSKCSGQDETSLPGMRSASFSGEGNAVDETGEPSKASFKKLSELWKAGTIFPMKMVGIDDPDDVERGDVYITSLSKTANHNETVGFSAEFKVTGPTAFTAEA